MSVSDISPILQEYDSLVHNLQEQLATYRKEHDILRSHLLELLSSNADLQKLVDEEFQRLIKPNNQLIHESETVTNLRQQLEISLSEREQLHNMHQTSQELILKLEKELNRRQVESPRNSKNNLLVSALESKIEEINLERSLEKSLREDLEKSILKFQTESAKLKIHFDEKTNTLRECELELKEKDNRLMLLEQELIISRSTLECVTQSRDSLEIGLCDSEKQIKVLQKRLEEARIKVEEAVTIAEKAVGERDFVHQREVQLQAEIQRLGQCLNDVIADAGVKVRDEIKVVKTQYDEKLNKLLEEFEKCCIDLSSKNVEIESLKRECKQLEKMLETSKEQITNDVKAEAIVMDLKEEMEAAREKIVETNKALSESLSSNSKLVLDLEISRKRDEENLKIFEKLQSRIKRCRCERLRRKFERYKESKLKQISELERQVAAHIVLNEKWQNESESLAALMEKKVRLSTKELEKAKKRNNILEARLREVDARSKEVYNVKVGCEHIVGK